MYSEIDQITSTQKQIILILNGDPSVSFPININHTTSFKEIENLSIHQFHFRKCKKIRIFTCKGVEIFPDDLQFIKNGSSLYISRGFV